jgi:hypothetical protein
MAQICRKCASVNPPEATYCYHDGVILGGHTARDGAAMGARPFSSQFVFPSGQVCGTFDQLAMACQQKWDEAVDLLRQGYLAGFLGGLGRTDLAAAAQEAARFPDLDRGLDQLLAKLPTQVLEPPRLKAEPQEVNLGVVPMGADRGFELHLANQGMRLLYGSVASDCKWLTLGDGPGNAQKLFQLRDEGAVPVHVRGQHLRAGNKPLEGQLVIDSNGGQRTVLVRLDVPVRPFSDGVLAGAGTPRQIAEKAKAAPKDAAKLFESGAVAQWFRDNGWTYPVQAPTASGLGAVQQFFEALGLASAPKVEVPEKAIQLQGSVGQALQYSLDVRTPEKRPIFAYATCDQPWLDVGRAKLSGRHATIPVLVPSVPNRPGETLQATVNVTANGNQRFAIPVTLTVGEGSPFAFAETVPAMSIPSGPGTYMLPAAAVEPVIELSPAAIRQVPASPLPAAEPFASFALGAAPELLSVPEATGSAPELLATPRRRRDRASVWIHILPAGLLLLALVGTLAKDFFAGPAPEAEPVFDPPRIKLAYDYPANDKLKVGSTMKFGLTMLDPDDPSIANAKKLTYDERGRSNSTVVRIDGADLVFGDKGGKWQAKPKKTGKYGGKEATWIFDNGIHVTQVVQIVPGEPQVIKGDYKSLLDTCLIRYTIDNRGGQPHKVGLRMVLDTFIGGNDGVPFTVPGLSGLVDQMEDFKGPKVPDYILVLENPDLKNPGTVAQVNLKLGGKLEAPARVSLTHWPGYDPGLRRFDVPVVPFITPLERDRGEGDSAVVLYWDEQDLPARKTRQVGFSYGLGSISSGTGQLALTVGGALVVNNELTVVGLVTSPQPGEKLILEVPAGLTLSDATPQLQPVAPLQKGSNRPSPVTWKVRANRTGEFTLILRSSLGPTQERRITVKANPLF